ncbi:MAG TPA: hypothetical protein VH442_02600 [Micromonosporaceae bacterium]
MIRLQDVVDHYLHETHRVVDVSCLDFPLDSFLHLPADVELTRRAEGETAQARDLIVDAIAFRAHQNGFLTHIRIALGALPSDAATIFLASDRPAQLSLREIDRIADSVGCRVLDVVRLAYPAWPTALVVGRDVDERLGGLTRPPLSTLGLTRGSRVAIVGVARRPADNGAIDERHRRQAEEHERELELRLALEQQLEKLRTSVALRLGNALVGVARKPSTAPRLPLQLVKIWKTWRERPDVAPLGASAAADAALAERTLESAKIDENHRFIAGLGAPTDRPGRLEVWGIVTDPVAAAVGEYASLSRLLPHEAKLAVEMGTPDLILVQTSALIPPSPWGHAGTPGGAVSYTRELHELFALAQGRGVPVVVWQDAPASLVPALGPLTRLADFAISGGDSRADTPRWSPGVPLARFQPGDKSVTDRLFIYDGDAGRVLPSSVARMRQELLRAGLATIGTAYSPELYDLVRQYSVVLASPLSGRGRNAIGDFSLAALASGSRVISGVNDEFVASFPSAVTPVMDFSDPVRTVRDVLAMPQLTAAERRDNLRRIFDEHATPVRLAWLASELGIKADPLVERQTAALLRVADTEALSPVLDSLLRQNIYPGRLVLATDEIPDRALDEVRALGITATVVPADQSWSAMAQLADVPWVTVWEHTGAISEDLLKDLCVAAECSRADAVGAIDAKDESYGRYVNALPSVQSLIRRDLVARIGTNRNLRVRADHGARLFGVNYTGAAQ